MVEGSALGMITIGQSPREDLVPEMTRWLGPARPLERGALDAMTKDEIAKLGPKPDDYALVTRLNDGASVTVAKHHLLTRIQAAITELEDEGVSAILLLCTGQFPAFEHRRPLLEAERLLVDGVRAIARGARTGVVCPLPEQKDLTREKWRVFGNDVCIVSASPYENASEELRRAACRMREFGAEYVVLDCMGYTQEMKEFVRAETGAPVLLARSVVARLAAEVL